MVEFKDFSRPLSVFQYISRQIYFSSTFQACANPEKVILLLAKFRANAPKSSKCVVPIMDIICKLVARCSLKQDPHH